MHRTHFFALAAVSSLLFSASLCWADDVVVNRTSAAQKNTLAAVIKTTFPGCEMIDPFFPNDDYSPSRVGSVMNGVQQQYINSTPVNLHLLDVDNYCAPKDPIGPDPGIAYKNLTYNYIVKDDASLSLELEKIFTGLSVSAEYLDQVSITFSNVKFRTSQADDKMKAIEGIADRPGCKSQILKTLPAKPNLINYPIVVASSCVGKVKVDFQYNRAFHASVLQAQLGKLKVGLGLNFQTTNQVEAPCPTTDTGNSKAGAKTPGADAKTPAPGAKADTKAPAGAAKSPPATGTSSDADAKSSLAAAAKLLADYLQKVADQAKAVGAPAADIKTTQDAADKAKQDAQTAANAAPTTDTKCYVGDGFETADDVVFGIFQQRVDQYIKVNN